MNNIIHEFIEKGIKNIEKNSTEIINNGGLTKLVDEIKKATDELGRNICKAFIESLEESIFKDSARKKSWYVEKKNETKTIATKLGEITYERTYYKSKKGTGYRHLVDAVLGVGVHEKIDAVLEAELVNFAADMSYEKSSKATSEIRVSRQTVMKNVHNLNEIQVKRVPKIKKQIDVLYVEADEDHVAMQDGTTSMPKLIYVHEGYDKDSNRPKLNNVYYFTELDKNVEEMWLDVAQYIDDNYEVEKIKRIYVSGDGAHWIKQGVNWLHNSKFVLDNYHINKYLMLATGHAQYYLSEMWEAIKDADKEYVIELFKELEKEAQRETDKREVTETKRYILRNWAGIQIKKDEKETVLGCSAEGHISHVLSDRLSSRPKGWCRNGVISIAKLRTFKSNGGDIYAAIRENNKKEEDYRATKKIMNITTKSLKGTMREQFNNIEIFKNGKINGLYKILSQIKYA